MKLLTHNMLTSTCLRGVTKGYPLKIIAKDVKEVTVDYSREFIQRMIPKIDWNVFVDAAKDFGVELPLNPPNETEPANDDALKQIHHALLEIEIVEGDLECPESQRKFPISRGIPNMLCNEDEV